MKKYIFVVLAVFALSASVKAQGVSLRMNALGWAMVIPNAGVEVALHERWSVLAEVYYSPLWDTQGFRFKGFMATPEVRYYLGEVFQWHYFGIHGNYAYADRFQVGSMNVREGNYYGAGVTYGYTWRIGKKWMYDMFIGLGWWQFKGDIYHQDYPDVKISDNVTENKFGLSRIGATFAYKF